MNNVFTSEQKLLILCEVGLPPGTLKLILCFSELLHLSFGTPDCVFCEREEGELPKQTESLNPLVEEVMADSGTVVQINPFQLSTTLACPPGAKEESLLIKITNFFSQFHQPLIGHFCTSYRVEAVADFHRPGRL